MARYEVVVVFAAALGVGLPLGACGSGSSATGSDAGATDSGSRDGFPSGDAHEGGGLYDVGAPTDGAICMPQQTGADAGTYFQLQINGTTKTAGEKKVLLDNDGRIEVAGGFPSLTLGSTHSEGLAAIFKRGLGTFG